MKLPLWSTRPIERDLNPVWEETAYSELLSFNFVVLELN